MSTGKGESKGNVIIVALLAWVAIAMVGVIWALLADRSAELEVATTEVQSVVETTSTTTVAPG